MGAAITATPISQIAGLSSVIHGGGVGCVCVPEFLFIGVLEVLRIEPTLSEQISHQASDTGIGHALGFQEPPDSSFVHETTPL